VRSDDTLTYVRDLFEEEWNGGSGIDRENDDGDEARPVATSSGSKKLLAESNASSDSRDVSHVNSGMGMSDKIT
jgi:hypothetical protein